MNEALRIALTVFGGWLLWLAVRKLGKVISSRIGPGKLRDFLTKDRGGY